MEDENQRLRREVGNFQEKIRQHERLSEAKKSELATEKDANKALKKALDSANGQLQRLNDHLKRLETERTRAITTAKQLQRSVERHKQKIARLEHGYLGPESGHSRFFPADNQLLNPRSRTSRLAKRLVWLYPRISKKRRNLQRTEGRIQVSCRGS